MRVGTSCWLSIRVYAYRDHPHACGDKPALGLSLCFEVGSSPCVWGQGFQQQKFDSCIRIIPMRVGTRTLSKQYEQQIKDHPHACGDKHKNSFIPFIFQGSSPCVWGQGISDHCIDHTLRIIPMRVGTSGGTGKNRHRGWDHPHACGDKFALTKIPLSHSGSSPCVWGQEGVYLNDNTAFRIIPMRVGTRSRVTVPLVRLQDHPHACGDKHNVPSCVLHGLGSSPCVWGQVDLDIWYQFDNRIIPMRVGTSAL